MIRLTLSNLEFRHIIKYKEKNMLGLKKRLGDLLVDAGKLTKE